MPAPVGGRPGDGGAEGSGDGTPTRSALFRFAAPLPRLLQWGVEAGLLDFTCALLSKRGQVGRLVGLVHPREPSP